MSWNILVGVSAGERQPAAENGAQQAERQPPFGFPNNTHPMYVEFNQQAKCTQKDLPWFPTTMLEFKVELPYLQVPGVGGPTMYKSIVYESSWVDVWGSEGVYGLPTHHADMARHYTTDNSTGSYSVKYDSHAMTGTFTPTGAWVPAMEDTKFQQSYGAINKYPWLCFPPLSHHDTRCADDVYPWSGARVRPVKMAFQVDDGMIPGLKAQTFNVDTLAYQVETTLVITSPYGCSP